MYEKLERDAFGINLTLKNRKLRDKTYSFGNDIGIYIGIYMHCDKVFL